jgi:hypothetical protein
MLLTNPHKVIRSRKMDARNIDKVQFRAPCRALRQDGITGFYAGLPASFPTLACRLSRTNWCCDGHGNIFLEATTDAPIKAFPQSMDMFD